MEETDRSVCPLPGSKVVFSDVGAVEIVLPRRSENTDVSEIAN